MYRLFDDALASPTRRWHRILMLILPARRRSIIECKSRRTRTTSDGRVLAQTLLYMTDVGASIGPRWRCGRRAELYRRRYHFESTPAGAVGIGPFRNGAARRALEFIPPIPPAYGPTSRDNGGAGCKQRTLRFSSVPI